MDRLALIAIGGHVLMARAEQGSPGAQHENARRVSQAVVAVMRAGYRVVLTHGNGPQVGAALLRSEHGGPEAYPHTLNVCAATTQGEIGYFLQQALGEELAAAGLTAPVVTIISQAVVSADYPALACPTKPIGPFYTRSQAAEHRTREGWLIVADAARGYRRVVPSPRPVEIVEEPVIRTLVSEGVLVIALGGGGIPVVRKDGSLRGIDAVIDKDYSSALLTTSLGANVFLTSPV